MSGAVRSTYVEGATSVGEIEWELSRLRVNQDGTLGARASVLNLLSVTDEESAPQVVRIVSELSEHYPSRAILVISDPEEERPNVQVHLSTFCGVRGGNHVCAEQVTLHVEGPPADHLESFAGPLLLPDLPIFLWYPNGNIPGSARCDGMAPLADRLILDTGAAVDRGSALRRAADLLDQTGLPALGDLQWAALSVWRSLLADLFSLPERAEELANIKRAEIQYAAAGECQALLLAAWLSSVLNWCPEAMERTEKGQIFYFDDDVTVELIPGSAETPLSRVHLRSERLAFQISRRAQHGAAYSTVSRGDELLAERAVRLGPTETGALLAEELRFLGQDATYEAALRRAVRMLDL